MSGGDSDETESLAAVIVRELRERDGKCIRVGSYSRGFPFIRYHDGEWQWADYEFSQNRVKGRVLEEDRVREIVDGHSFHLLDTNEAIAGLTDDGPTIWEDADEQDVFTDYDRCFWCGQSERSRELDRYETTEDGECLLCPECHDSFNECGQIARQISEEASA